VVKDSQTLRGASASSAGFTILEILVVMVIVALVFASTPVLLQAALPSLRLQSASRDLAASLRLARSLAVSRGDVTEVRMDLERRRYRIPRLSREHELPRGVALRSTGGKDAEGREAVLVRFFPDGSSSGGRIELRGGKSAYLLEVDPVRGRVRGRKLAGDAS
jgi:general secretion pathway protein H